MSLEKMEGLCQAPWMRMSVDDRATMFDEV